MSLKRCRLLFNLLRFDNQTWLRCAVAGRHYLAARARVQLENTAAFFCITLTCESAARLVELVCLELMSLVRVN